MPVSVSPTITFRLVLCLLNKQQSIHEQLMPVLILNNTANNITQEVFFGINLQKLLNLAHYISAGMVSFARGLNDTPKIVALLIAVQGLSIKLAMIAVAVGIALGGLLNAKRIAETMGKKITPMSHGQGFAANLVTGFMVIFASRLGVPVSTTHCSVGSLFGIGLITGKANKRVITNILISWLLTLPVAAALSAMSYWLLNL